MTLFAKTYFYAYNNTMSSKKRTPLNADYINQNIQSSYKVETIFTSIDSTNTYLKENISRFKHGIVVIAKHQTMGRGRYERRFESNDDSGIYCSFLLKDNLTNECINQINLKIACALQHSIKQIYGINTLIKWPNDLIIDQKKCGGILIESSINSTTKKHDAFIIGFGLNIYKQTFSNTIMDTATTLEDNSTSELNRNDLIIHFFNNLNDFLFHSDIINYYKKYMLPINTWVNLTINNSKEFVRIVDLNEAGQLLVITKTNYLLTLFNDEISL